MSFHLTPAGPRPCRARKRPCPLGGEHYKSEAEAWAAHGRQEASRKLPPAHRKRGAGGVALPEASEWTVYDPAASSSEGDRGLALETVLATPQEWTIYGQGEEAEELKPAGAPPPGVLLSVATVEERRRVDRLREELLAGLSPQEDSLAQAFQGAAGRYGREVVASPALTFGEALSLSEQWPSHRHPLVDGEAKSAITRALVERADTPVEWYREQVQHCGVSPEVSGLPLRGPRPSVYLYSPALEGLPEASLARLVAPARAGDTHPGSPHLRTMEGWDSPHFPAEWAAEHRLWVEEEGAAPGTWGGFWQRQRPGVARLKTVDSRALQALSLRAACPERALEVALSSRAHFQQLSLARRGSAQPLSASLRPTPTTPGNFLRLQASEGSVRPEVALAAVGETARALQELAPLVDRLPRERPSSIPEGEVAWREESWRTLLEATTRACDNVLELFPESELGELARAAESAPAARLWGLMGESKRRGEEFPLLDRRSVAHLLR